MATNATAGRASMRADASHPCSSRRCLFNRSSVSVLDEVSTSELKVDIEAESTSTMHETDKPNRAKWRA